MDRMLYKPAAAALDQALLDRTVTTRPSAMAPDISVADGYEIQRLWTELRVARGERTVGYKIGFTSKAMQKAFHVDTPLFGQLFDSALWQGDADIALARFIRPQLELELAFVIGRPLDMTMPTIEAVIQATEYVQPALELIDFRTTTPRPVPDMVADNAAGAGAILGGQRISPRSVDLKWVAATFTRNGDVEETGVAAAVLNHPANAVLALAMHLHQRGQQLAPGDIVLSGSFGRSIEVATGDAIVADYGPLGAVAVGVG